MLVAGAVENETKRRQALRAQRAVALHELHRPRVQVRPDAYAVKPFTADVLQVRRHVDRIHGCEIRDEGHEPGRPVDREPIALNRQTLRVSGGGPAECEEDENQWRESATNQDLHWASQDRSMAYPVTVGIRRFRIAV